MPIYDEKLLAELLRLLQAPPQSWVRRAQMLPFSKPASEVLARASEDEVFRAALLENAEATLTAAGYDLEEEVVAHIHRRLDPPGQGRTR